MAVITVRLSEKEKTSLEKYGKISDVIRDALRLYVNDKKARDALKRMEGWQKKNPLTETADEIVAMIREDRESH
jgi:Arc/MetJ-type ribon-helix-helix transcriptional regulator